MNTRPATNFSYSALWDDTSRMLKTHSAILIALAGVFVFLPNLLSTYLLPFPQAKSIAEVMSHTSAYMERNWHWQLLIWLITSAGAISIILVLMGREASTVGDAISRSFRLLPAYLLALICSNVILLGGLLLFVIPFLYLFGRLCIVGPVVVAERRTGPFDAIRRSFELTKGFGWAVIGLIAIIFVVGMLLSGVVTLVLGTILVLILGQGLGGFLLLMIGAALSASLATVLLVLYVAIYRRLSAQTARVPTSGI